MAVTLFRYSEDGKLYVCLDVSPDGCGEQLISYLKKHFYARVVSKTISFEWVCVLKIGIHQIKVYSDQGDIIMSAEDPSGENIIEEIAESLRKDFEW